MEIIVSKPKTEAEIKEFADCIYELILAPDKCPRESLFFPPELEAIIRRFIFRDKTTNNLIGTGCVRLIGDGIARISYVSIKKEYQGLGLGRRMVQLLESTAFKLGASKIQLASARGKEPFYHKLGYTIVGEEVEKYGDVVDRCNVLMKNLFRTSL